MIDTTSRNDDVDDLPLREWRCTGRRADGRVCNQVLAEYATDSHVALRKRCDKCGTWNTTVR